MKYWIVCVLVAGSAQMVSAHGCGSTFGAAFGGSVLGSMVGGAITQPRYREVTYVEQAPAPTYYYDQRERDLAAREARLKEKERLLKKRSKKLKQSEDDDLDAIIYLDEDYIY